jgi:signal recognition particle GTPase
MKTIKEQLQALEQELARQNIEMSTAEAIAADLTEATFSKAFLKDFDEATEPRLYGCIQSLHFGIRA